MTSQFAARRATLCERVRQHHPKNGVIVLWGNLETGAQPYTQDATFYYYTGVREPGCVMALDSVTGQSILFVPQAPTRARWVGAMLLADQHTAQKLGFDDVRYVGAALDGYTLPGLFSREQYRDCLAWLVEMVRGGRSLFTPYPTQGDRYIAQIALIQRLCIWQPELAQSVVDISAIIADMRRKKSREEIELIYKAIVLTNAAQQAAASLIKPGRTECEVQAAVEYVFTSNGAAPAFQTIVASGPNAAIIHYHPQTRSIQKDELVIVDCGACIDSYCADISRTYPIGKKSTPAQRALYGLVLQAHDYVAGLIKPGMYLNNAQHPDQSLHHLAAAFFAERGHGDYFAHGIGHFLGLEVHDVGDPHQPLAEGDVITIEPGLYLAEKQLGVRIENDYWVIDNGAHCLSEDLPVAFDEIAQMVA